MGSQGWFLIPQSDHLGVYKVTEEITEPGRLWESHSQLLHVDPEMHPAGKQYSPKGSGLRMRSSKTLFSFFPTMSHSKSFAYFFFSYFQPPGHQEAIAVCLHLQTQQTVNDTLCDMVHRPPAMSQACNTEPCPPRYVQSSAPRRESRMCIEAEGESPKGIRVLPSPFKVCASQILTKIHEYC